MNTRVTIVLACLMERSWSLTMPSLTRPPFHSVLSRCHYPVPSRQDFFCFLDPCEVGTTLPSPLQSAAHTVLSFAPSLHSSKYADTTCGSLVVLHAKPGATDSFWCPLCGIYVPWLISHSVSTRSTVIHTYNVLCSSLTWFCNGRKTLTTLANSHFDTRIE